MNRLITYYGNRPFALVMVGLSLVYVALLVAGFDPLAVTGGFGLAMAAAAKEAETLRKITVGTIEAQPDIEELLKKEGKRMDLADFIGIATKAKPGSSDFGPFVAFLGQFQAKNLSTGNLYTSRKIILPKFIEEELFGAFDADGNGNVEFAFRLSAKYDKEAATKYVYEMKSIIKPKENAQFTELLTRAAAEMKSLPAPKG